MRAAAAVVALAAAASSLAPEPRIQAPKVSSRRGLLAGVPVAALLGGAAVVNAKADWENEFKLADADNNGKLTRVECGSRRPFHPFARDPCRPSSPTRAPLGSRSGTRPTRCSPSRTPSPFP